MNERLKTALWLVLVLGLLVGLQLPQVLHRQVNPDEATYGLMGRHILAGGHLPVFYNGYGYMGAQKAYLAALMWIFLPPTHFNLMMLGVFISALFVAATFYLARLAYGRPVAMLASLLAAVPAAHLAHWYHRLVGGYVELPLLGCLIFICYFAISRGSPRPTAWLLALGFLLGFGWWDNPQIVYAGLAVGLFLLLYHRPLLFSRRLAALAAGALIGAAPAIVWNIFHRFITFRMAKSSHSLSGFLGALGKFYARSLPINLGLALPEGWLNQPLPPYLRLAIWAVVLCLALGLGLWLLERLVNKERPDRPTAFFLSFILISSLVYANSIYSGWRIDARYSLGLWAAAPVLLAFLIWQLRKLARWLPYLAAALVLALNLGLTYLLVKDNYQIQKKDIADEAEILDFLGSRGISDVYTHTFIFSKYTFTSREKIVFCQMNNELSPAYAPATDARPAPAFLLDHPIFIGQTEAVFRALDLTWQRRDFRQNLYQRRLLYDVGYEPRRLREITPELWQVSQPDQDGPAAALFGRRYRQGWEFAAQQRPGRFLTLDLGRPCRIGQVELVPLEFDSRPRSLALEVSADGRRWDRVVAIPRCDVQPAFISGPHPFLKEINTYHQLRFRPRPVRYLRFYLLAEDKHPLAFDEVFVYEDLGPGRTDWDAVLAPARELAGRLGPSRILAPAYLSAQLHQVLRGRPEARLFYETSDWFNDLVPKKRTDFNIVDLQDQPLLFLPPENIPALEQMLKRHGIGWQRRDLPGYAAYHDFLVPAGAPRFYWLGTHLLEEI